MQASKSGARRRAFIYFLALCGALPLTVLADTPSMTPVEGALSLLSSMKSIYTSQYAPAAWKQTQFGYDLQAEYQRAAALLLQPSQGVQSSRDAYKAFIYSMRDYHTSVSFNSTEEASLPFTVMGAGGRIFLVAIDRDKLPETAFPFRTGDELISFDGTPALDAVKAVQAQIPEIVSSTDRAIAEQRLTQRQASRGMTVPHGPVAVGIRRRGSAAVVSAQLIWEYTPEKIRSRFDPLVLHPVADLGANSGARPSLFAPRMDVDLFDSASPLAADKPNEKSFGLGARRTFTPDLGVKIWESAADSIFDAYIFKAPDRRLIGYVRIAGYMQPSYAKALAEFTALAERFEASTDALVIDQVNNPGGSVAYLYSLAGLLTDRPLTTPRHRMAVNQTYAAEALRSIAKLEKVKSDDDAKKMLSIDEFDGVTTPTFETAQFMLQHARFIVSEWNAGKKLTSPFWIGGFDHINPAPKHYSKPILILINQLDFSGGDFFPAIMQDNHRATIMGARTSGAGGYVRSVTIPNDVGVDSFRVTESIAERADGQPIENLGVTADKSFEYEMTVEDLSNGFAPYANAIREAMQRLTN